MLINAHCHSEWNAAPNLARGDGMMPWLERVLALEGKADRSAGMARTEEVMTREGVAFLADHGRASSVVTERAFPGIHFRELLRDDAESAKVQKCKNDPIGLAPHAVHTVFEGTWERIAEFGGSISVHVGESPEEMALYQSGAGPMAELLGARNFPRGHISFLKGRSPIRILDEYRLLGPQTLIVHGLYLCNSDYDLIAERGAHVVLCPVSNREIGVGFVDAKCKDAPGLAALRKMLDRGIDVALGTDSALSCSTLSMKANGDLLREFGVGEETVRKMLENRELFSSDGLAGGGDDFG